MAFDPSTIQGVQAIRVHRYDNNNEDIAGNIKFARKIRVNHNGTIRSYLIKSVSVDSQTNDAYYIEVKADRTSQPGGGTALDVALSPLLQLDLDYHEYNAVFGNADENVTTAGIYKVVHNTLAGAPDNLENLISGSEELAQVSEGFFTDTGLANARFEGTKNTSTDINIYQAGDAAGFKKPAVEVTQDYYAVFNYLGGTSPEIPNKVAADIKYLVGADGSIIDPKTDDDAIHFVKENFQAGDFAIVELDDPKAFGNEMSSLNGEHEIIFSGVYPAPITNNHFPALPSWIVGGNGGLRYGDSIVYQHKETDALTAAGGLGDAFTYLTPGVGTYTTSWITGSNAITESDGGITLYNNSNYRQIGVGIWESGTKKQYLDTWIASGDLEEGTDYLLSQSLDGTLTHILYTPTTGYNTINDAFTIEQYDYISFQSTANWRRTFQILEVVYNSSQNEVYLRLDGTIEVVETAGSYDWTDISRNKFSIIRHKDSPTLVTLDTDKAPGATSGGILKPKYVSEEAEKAIKEALATLR